MKRKGYRKHRRELYDKTGGRCWYCGVEMSYKESQIDHIYPRARGGSDAIGNLNICCRTCNSQKKTKTLTEYREWLRWKSIGVEPFTEMQEAWLAHHGIEAPEPPPHVFYGDHIQAIENDIDFLLEIESLCIPEEFSQMWYPSGVEWFEDAGGHGSEILT